MSEARVRVEKLVKGQPVVLFMKGTRGAPSCGFSAKVVDALDEYLDEYLTIDVLSDAELRDGVKALTDWPTIPQLFVAGRFVGGADIVRDMVEARELLPLLRSAVPGAGKREIPMPEVHVTERALDAFRRFSETTKPNVRMSIDGSFETDLELEGPHKGDMVIDMGELVLAMDRRTAERAMGLTIDFVDGPRGAGFSMDNPNKPAPVRPMRVSELAALRQSGKPFLLLDVRTEHEHATADIAGSVLASPELLEELDEADRLQMIVCFCHHGVRSMTAGKHLTEMGFREVYNLEGGIDAWSVAVDPTVPRY